MSRLIGLLRTESPSLLVVGRLSATALAFLTAPIVARAIGPEGRGETAAAIALFTIVPIVLAIGVPLEVRRLAAIGQGAEALRAARIFCLGALPVSIAVGVIAYLTLFASFDSSARLVAAIGIAVCPLMMSWTCDLSVLIASGRFRGVMALQLVQPVTYLLFVIVFLLAGVLSTGTVLVANIAGTVSAFITGATLSRIPLRGVTYRLGGLLRGGVRFAGSSIAEAASSRLDQVIALPLIGAVQAGLYSVAVTVASIPLAVGQALGATYFPIIARTEPEERRVHKEEAVRVAVAGALMCLPLIAIGSWLGIPILFGSEFFAAVPVAWISGLGTCALIVAYVCSMVLAAEGRGYRMTLAQLLALGVAILLLFLLAPRFGAVGAAAASTFGYFVLLAFLSVGLGARVSRSMPAPRDFRLVVARLVRGRQDPSPPTEPASAS